MAHQWGTIKYNTGNLCFTKACDYKTNLHHKLLFALGKDSCGYECLFSNLGLACWGNLG